MSNKRPPFFPRAPDGGVSRRSFLRGAAGAAGAGVVAGSGLWTPAAAQVMPGAGDPRFRLHAHALTVDPPSDPTPISHVFFFPGPPDTGDPCVGRDQSVINNFKRFIGATDITFRGRGTDLATGASHPYRFHADMRFMKGEFIGADGKVAGSPATAQRLRIQGHCSVEAEVERSIPYWACANSVPEEET